MIAVGRRHNVKVGHEFERFFTSPVGKNITVKKEARLKDTIKWMKKVIAMAHPQTENLARHLQGAREILTCKLIWRFCFEYFQYKRDTEGIEELRTPNRAWADRRSGIDCDCFTILIGTLLTNLGIPFVMRITRYDKDKDFEHVYPVALTEGGEVIIDAVVHKFNYEVPYIEKEDFEMELQVLNGVKQTRYNELGDKVIFEHDLPIDAEDLFLDADDLELQGLEGKAEREARRQKRKDKRDARKDIPVKDRLKQGLKKGMNVINKANPATMLLRAGVLASLKLNVFKVASYLRFTYWTESEARANQMDVAKYHDLQRIRQKMEKIYYGAGGKVEALKKAILEGKGNRNQMVRLHGLGSVNTSVADEDDLRTILGGELFYAELDGLSGLGGFGEPTTIATGAAITAASGLMGTLAALIKKLGSLFKKGSEANEKFKIQDNTENEEEKKRKFSLKNVFKTVANKIKSNREAKAGESNATEIEDVVDEMDVDPVDQMLDQGEPDFEIDNSEMDLTKQSDPDEAEPTPKSGDDSADGKGTGLVAWVQENPGKTALISLGTVALIGTTIYVVKKSKQKQAVEKKQQKQLNGAPKVSQKKKKPASKPKKGTSKRIPKVELL